MSECHEGQRPRIGPAAYTEPSRVGVRRRPPSSSGERAGNVFRNDEDDHAQDSDGN